MLMLRPDLKRPDLQHFVLWSQHNLSCWLAGIRTPPVTVLKEEPPNVPLPATAYMNLQKPVASDDSSLKILEWTFAQHMPSSWVLS